MLTGRIVGPSEKRNSVRKHLPLATLGGSRLHAYYYDGWAESRDIVSLPACHALVARSEREALQSCVRTLGPPLVSENLPSARLRPHCCADIA